MILHNILYIVKFCMVLVLKTILKYFVLTRKPIGTQKTYHQYYSPILKKVLEKTRLRKYLQQQRKIMYTNTTKKTI